ncbi:MAG: hypothetical protein KJO18_05870, partial [Acidimicrobiia bacterium]|nr:hypothetical protein [Acidimicrobiia bacterium]
MTPDQIPEKSLRRPSVWWLLVTIVAAALAAVLALVALQHQREVTRPVGEGDLFVNDAREGAHSVARFIADGDSVESAVKRLRNQLNIEAVAAVSDGLVVAATAPELVGVALSNPVLSFGHESQRVTAIAVGSPTQISIDGVAEWETGDVLYQVHQPSVDGGPSLLLFYDVGELLERRIRTTGIAPLTLQLTAAALGLALVAAMLLIGRARTVRRYRELARESEMLHRHATELTLTNVA